MNKYNLNILYFYW